MLLIQTRWSEDDLAGRALSHEKWKVVSLPALAEPGDPLGRAVGEPLWCDDGYGYGEQLIELSTKTPARTWSAMYQQRPAPEEGDYFKAGWLRPYDSLPPREMLKVYGASDYAVTADGGDYTVHIVVGVDPEWRIYVLDPWRAQTSAEKWVETFCDLVRSGSRSAGRKSRDRSGLALGRFSSGGCGSVRRMSLERSFRHAVTRPCGHSLSAVVWNWTASMCRCERRGTRIFAQSF
jgi:hypothetical protein